MLNFDRLITLIKNEPLIEAQLSLASLKSSSINTRDGNIFYGTGICTPENISLGLPFDVLGMVFCAEIIRKTVGFGRVFHHIADTHAKTNKIFDENLKWPFNFSMTAHSKTTTGGNVANARFSDASMFHWQGTFSKTFAKTDRSHFLAKAMLGFYTWQTNINGLINGSTSRQNDAPLYGIGLEYETGLWHFDTDFSGYYGYQGHRDYPGFLRFNMIRDIKGGEISLGYNVGVKTWDWNTFSIGYRINVVELLN